MRKGLVVLLVGVVVGRSVYTRVKDREVAETCRSRGAYPMAGKYSRHCIQVVGGDPVVVPVNSLR